MTVTDELRAMLDERGVEWAPNAIPLSDVAATFWIDCNGNVCSAVGGTSDLSYSMLSVQANFTPAQAIAATLGADECAIEHNVDGSYKCPKCGCVVDYDIRGDDERIITMDDYVIPFNHCPKCGRRIVEVDE